MDLNNRGIYSILNNESSLVELGQWLGAVGGLVGKGELCIKSGLADVL